VDKHMFRPKSVEYAIYFGVAAYLVGFVSVPFRWSKGVELVGLQNQLLMVFVPAIIFLGLYYLVYNRKNWARITLLVLLAISLPGYVTSLIGTGSVLYKTTQFFQMVLFGGSAFMLCLKESRSWYKETAS
jgi:hypothetical protein